MRIGNDSLVIDTDLSTNQTSDPIWLAHIVNYSIQLVFTGTPNGSFKLQVSNDEGNPSAVKKDNVDYGVDNWSDVADSSTAITAAGNVFYDVSNTGARWVRLVWTASSSTGTITSARFNVKGV